MAYLQPMVMVYQEYDSTGISTPTADLPPCIIGPCMHIVDPWEDEALALCGHYTKEGVEHMLFPRNAPGAKIQRDTVQFRLKNAQVEICNNVGVEVSTSTNALMLKDSEIMLDYIGVGDSVKLEGYENLRVVGVNKTNKTIILNRTISTTAGATCAVVRTLEEVIVPGDTPGKVILDITGERFTLTGLTASIDDLDCDIVDAELYVGYHALRQDLSDITTIYSVNECLGKLGKICPENPLAFGVNIALANSEVGIQCIGVDSDDLAGYTAAKDRLEQQDPVYAIAPLTFDIGVLTMFKQHCIAYSKPEMSKWRMTIGCTELTKTRKVCEGWCTLTRDGDGDLVVVNASDPDMEFLSSDADSGDAFYIYDDTGEKHRYTCATIVTENLLTTTQSNPFDDEIFKDDGTEYAFEIIHLMDRDQQAKWIAQASRAYGDPRFVNIYPGTCIVDDVEVPGYYLSCAVAAGIASLPSHYGMTRLSVAGISGVRGSGDYFNNDQLDLIADGGTFIFTQETQVSPPYIRHQLTTDRSTVEFQELSFVKNFDYISYICRDVLQAFIGKWNICPATLGSLRTTLDGTLEVIKLDSQPKIGSRLLDYSIVSVAQSENVRDRVEMYAEISMPYPLNTIGLHLKHVFLQVTA